MRVTALVLPSVLLLACSSGTDEAKQASAWTCEPAEVPMGEVVRCTQTVAANDTHAQAPSPADTTGAVQIHTYGLPDQSGDSDAGAPPPASDTPTPPPPPTSYGCAPGDTSSDCPDAPPSSTPLPSSPDECSYMPDLPYCAAGGASSSPPSGDSGFRCTKDMNGNKVCETTPSCGAGAHPSPGTCGACVADDEPGECVPPSEGGCWVTGGGFIVEPSTVPAQAAADGHDNFGGNAKQMKGGTIQGHWNHVDHGTMNHLNGRPEYIYCRHVDEPGPGQPGGKKGFDMNQIYFGGHAKWGQGGGQDGYWFDVVAKDHGEPGSQPSPKNGFMVDTYHFTVRKMDDPQAKASGPIVYEVKGGLVGGNIQMHPPNGGHPGFQSPLPAWVGLEP